MLVIPAKGKNTGSCLQGTQCRYRKVHALEKNMAAGEAKTRCCGNTEAGGPDVGRVLAKDVFTEYEKRG